MVPASAHAGTSLRFFGNSGAEPGANRVTIPLDAPARPVDVGAGDFTLEFWMKALPGENGNDPCSAAEDAWIAGNIIFDRDIYGAGDHGDYGISLTNGRIAFGVHNGATGATACGATSLADGTWRHVAVTRRASDGLLRIFVDGRLDGSVDGPEGNLSYRDGRSTGFPWDPYLVVGAEKHNGPPAFAGWVDEIRLSTTVRYTGNFVPSPLAFAPDAATAALYHLDEGTGNVVGDSSGAAGGPSHGTRQFGGDPAGPLWSSDSPLPDVLFQDGFESGS
jgi:hypothetical protein